MKNNITILVRAVVQKEGKILVCRKIGKKYYFFPGGHVECGEDTKDALEREIKEELGRRIKKCKFVGGSEHIFTDDGRKHHEINLAFEVRLDNLQKIASKEDHLCFFWLTEKELDKEKVLPACLTKAVIKWRSNKRPFWTSRI